MKGKRKGETSYKETAFGIIPRSKLIPLEIEGAIEKVLGQDFRVVFPRYGWKV